MDAGFQAMHCQEASWERLPARRKKPPPGHCEERFRDEAISPLLVT